MSARTVDNTSEVCKSSESDDAVCGVLYGVDANGDFYNSNFSNNVALCCGDPLSLCWNNSGSATKDDVTSGTVCTLNSALRSACASYFSEAKDAYGGTGTFGSAYSPGISDTQSQYMNYLRKMEEHSTFNEYCSDVSNSKCQEWLSALYLSKRFENFAESEILDSNDVLASGLTNHQDCQRSCKLDDGMACEFLSTEADCNANYDSKGHTCMWIGGTTCETGIKTCWDLDSLSSC